MNTDESRKVLHLIAERRCTLASCREPHQLRYARAPSKPEALPTVPFGVVIVVELARLTKSMKNE